MFFATVFDKKESGPGFGVVVPDLAGCYSGSDIGLEDAVNSAKEAIHFHLSELKKDGQLPEKIVTSSIESLTANPDWNDAFLIAYVDVDVNDIFTV